MLDCLLTFTDNFFQVSWLQSKIIPHLRVLARTLGWEVSVAISPALLPANSNRSIAATDVLRVASSVLKGKELRAFVDCRFKMKSIS